MENTDEQQQQNNKHKLYDEHELTFHFEKRTILIWIFSALLVLVPIIVAGYVQHKSVKIAAAQEHEPVNSRTCFETCRIEIVESIPQNLTFDGYIPPSTYEIWHNLISGTKDHLELACYKTSLRGKHVFGKEYEQDFSIQGETIYELLRSTGLDRKINIRMVENSPAKDPGDNEDGRSLNRIGAITRRSLNLQKLSGSGTMHAKFMLSDNKDFYLGSANLDWRSLNQKMEMGIFVQNCPCLAEDLTAIFDSYWQATQASSIDDVRRWKKTQKSAKYSMKNPLRVIYEGSKADVYIATSPKSMSQPDRTWDLDAIVYEINNAEKYLNIHVMDYFPMFMYAPQRRYWSAIDNAIRDAIIRGVKVRMLVSALHFPSIGMRFMMSLQDMDKITNNASIEIRVFKVPTDLGEDGLLRRERRTHNKFMVTEKAAVIGTSNWSGDYFEYSTGAAIVVKQNITENGVDPPFIRRMRSIFKRDWDSSYSHPLEAYYEQCILSKTGTFCEEEKDISIFSRQLKNDTKV